MIKTIYSYCKRYLVILILLTCCIDAFSQEAFNSAQDSLSLSGSSYNTGNQLKSANDSAASPARHDGFGFRDGAHEPVEYSYDANGNLTKDLNKNITDIQYNVLNLPSRVVFSNGNRIEHVYDARGTKLRTVHHINGTTRTTDYCGNAIYEDGELKMLLNAAGYYSFQDNKYHFYLKDHQGNVRVVADEDGNVEETNDYYPFGGLMSNSSASVQPYKYNGKELDKQGGLDWYDYGARHYDPVLGRFMTVDPMAEKYYGWSPYAYCLGNPMRFIDPTGMFTETPPGFWESFGKGFSQPFVSFWNTISHPVETATNMASSIKNATPVEVGLGIGEQMLRSTMSPLSGALNQMDVVQAVAYDKVNGTMTSAEVVGSQWGDIAFDAGATAIGAGVGKAAGTLGKVSSAVGEVKGLGNPFKNMTLDQVRTSMDKHLNTGKLKVVNIDRTTGLNKTYFNNKSGYSYNLDEGGIGRKGIKEPAHVDVNYAKPKPRLIEKKKLPIIE